VVVIDEIAPMELFSDAFREAVLEALDAPCRVLATIQRREHPFLDAIRRRPDVTLVEVSPENRDTLVTEIAADLVPAP
jgi:nucleoside-triphosphatase